MGPKRFATAVAVATLVAGVSAMTTAGTAAAAVQEGLGYNVTPAQPYQNNPDQADWLGSYVVGGKQVWCVDFAYKAPDSNEQYQPGEPLLTKWGTALDPTVAAEISYLLLRYGNTNSADDAAALAHLLHSWTAAPQNSTQLDPSNDFRNIAYDVNYHYNKLPTSAQQAVHKLQADAEANHGPWKATLTKPSGGQIIGTADTWTITVLNAAGTGVPNVPVNLTATDATLPGGQHSAVLSTPADGSPLKVAVTPTGAAPNLVATLASPAAVPVAQAPVDVNAQHTVSTGGESQLTAQASTTAQTAPGKVTVTKTDAASKAPIAGASLELTAADKASAATKQDGSSLVGADGKPIVLQTGADGTVTFADLKTPQDVCVIETAPAAGYEQEYQAASPPTVCGSVTPGATLTLSLTNTANKVPVAIPAGGAPPHITAAGMVRTEANPIALIGSGILLLGVAGLTGSLAVRRRRRQ